MIMPNVWKPSSSNKTRESRNHINQDKRKALIVGISNYNDLRPLDLCKNDAEELSKILSEQGYEIPDDYKLIGEINYNTLRDTIYNFFDNDYIRPKDTLLFYFSGHGIPDGYGRHYLAASDIDKNRPGRKGISFDDLEYLIEISKASRIVTILDCCFSGAAGLEGVKGEDDNSVAKKAREAIDKKIKESEGRCILASSLAYQESIIKKDLGHSLFTYYLLEGLKGKKECVDSNGYVTADLLGKYVFEKILEEPRQLQKPIRKSKVSGDIIVAHHPQLAESLPERYSPSPVDTSIIFEGLQYLENEDFNSAIKLFDQAIAVNPKNAVVYNYKGDVLFKSNKYEEAIKSYDEALKINPKYSDVLKDKGLALYNLGRYEQAIQCFNTALQKTPESPQIWYYKGLAFTYLSKYNEAIECYNEALKINPNYADAAKKKTLALDYLLRKELLTTRLGGRTKQMIERRFALIIVTSNYSDPDFKQLIQFTGQETESLARVLKDPEIGNFEVKTIINQPSYVIKQEMERLFANSQTDDLLLLYFYCHGIKDPNGRLFFAAVDTSRKNLNATGIPASFVNKVMQESRSHRQVVLLDCCYGGAFMRDSKDHIKIYAEEQLSGRGRAVMTASDAMQYSIEEEENNIKKSNAVDSFFTNAIIEGVEKGKADINVDGYISFDELYDYVYRYVKDKTKSQTPTKSLDGVQGQILIAQNRNTIFQEPGKSSNDVFKINPAQNEVSKDQNIAPDNLKKQAAKSYQSCNEFDYSEGRGRIILSASNAAHYLFDDDITTPIKRERLVVNSTFTYSIIKGLETGEADLDNDGFITCKELYDFVYQHETKEVPPGNPVIWSFKTVGDIVVAKNSSIIHESISKKEIRRFALIIATSEYHDSNLRNLITPGQYAEALASVLKNPAIGPFEVKILLNQPSYKLTQEIGIFFEDRKRDDLLLLYFSCHSIKDKDEQLYFAAVDTQCERLSSTAVSVEFVNQVCTSSYSRTQLMILDCYFSGAFTRDSFVK